MRKNVLFFWAGCMAVGVMLPAQAFGHRMWLLPSSTVLSGKESWVTVDAAVSNGLFYFDHRPLSLNGLYIQGPGGQQKAENIANSVYRNTFDVKLSQPGTYRIAVVNEAVMASWQEGSESKRWRGSESALQTAVPAGASNLVVSKSRTRVETFVTLGKPSWEALKPSGKGLELEPLTHPNDLVAGEVAKFRFLVEGKPAAGITVTVAPAGKRYKENLQEFQLTTGAGGEFQVTFPEAGLYWLNATNQPGTRPGPSGSEARPLPAGAAGPGRAFSGDRYSYAVTLEALPQ